MARQAIQSVGELPRAPESGETHDQREDTDILEQNVWGRRSGATEDATAQSGGADDQREECVRLEAVRRGEHDAFAAIIEHYQGRLYNYLYRFTHNRDDCEDLVSTTLFQAFRELSSCRDLAKFRAWLFRIAHNLGVNFWRKRNRDQRWTTRLENLAFEVASWANSPEEETSLKEEGWLVEQALKELPAHYRSALFLFYYEGFSYNELCALLGVSLAAVKTHLFRGRKLLEAKLRNVMRPAAGFKTDLATVTPQAERA